MRLPPQQLGYSDALYDFYSAYSGETVAAPVNTGPRLVGNTCLPGNVETIHQGKGWYDVRLDGAIIGVLRPGGPNGIFETKNGYVPPTLCCGQIVSYSKSYMDADNGPAQAFDLLHRPLPQPRGPRPPDEMLASNPEGYLRAALASHDWESVGKWYGVTLQRRLNQSIYAADFWDLATLNLRDYTSEPWDMEDLRGFAHYVFGPYLISDLGAKVGFGATGNWWKIDLSDTRGAFNIFQTWREIANCNYYPPLQLGWVREPSTNWARIAIGIIGGALIGAGLAYAAGLIGGGGAAASSAGALATSAPTGATAATTAAGMTAASGGVVTTAAGVVTEVVTVASAGGISAGTVATVGGALAAGAVVTAAAPAPLAAPAPQVEPGIAIEEIVTTATRLPEVSAGAAASGAASGAVIALTSQPPAPLETTAPESLQTEPGQNTAQETQGETASESDPGFVSSIKDYLASLAQTMGLQYVQDYLAQILAERMGRQPTDDEILYYDDYLVNGDSALTKAAPFLLAGALALAFLLPAKKERRK